jgi:hypothetical protein
MSGVTKKIIRLFTVLVLMTLVGCSHSNTGTVKTADHAQAVKREAKILQSWQGDYPVDRLHSRGGCHGNHVCRAY